MPMPNPLLREFPDCYLLRRAAETFGSGGRWSAGRGRPPQAAARRAGLEFVEKLLTANLTSTDTRSGISACRSAFRSSHRWSSWLLALAARRPGGRRRRHRKLGPRSSAAVQARAHTRLRTARQPNRRRNLHTHGG